MDTNATAITLAVRNASQRVTNNNAGAAKICARYQSGSPLWLISADRNKATEAFPLWLAPPEARIVAVGAHNFLPMTAVAWVSVRNELLVAIQGQMSEVGRSLLIRLWTKDSRAVSRAAAFHAQGKHAIAIAEMGSWNGLPVAGLMLLSLIAPGEES